MPISPFAREALAEILADLEKTGDLLASLVFQEGLEDEIPATVPEDIQTAIAALESALAEPEGLTVAQAAMAQRRAAWNDAEGEWNEAQARHETACKAERLGMLDGATIRFESEAYRKAESAYLEAKADAEKAGFL
jgi:Asp-tRNA(Asn)/Glu-tRNA(Gln) amidotransferase A subunit family amidase